MKKNIVIAVLSVMTLLSFMYAFVQQAEAVKQREYAIDAVQRAEAATVQAIECQQTAERLQQAVTDGLAVSEAQKAIAEKSQREAKK